MRRLFFSCLTGLALFGACKLINISLLSNVLIAHAIAGKNLPVWARGGRAGASLPAYLLSRMASYDMESKAPILLRIYKEESSLEIWKEKRDKHFALLISYPICRWSGRLGPKYYAGDLQSPEGFYHISSWQLNPFSHYYLSINIGYPNNYDKIQHHLGGNIMIHGGCRSMGCFAMQDKNIAEIYGLIRDALLGGQKSIQLEIFPFHMTAGNMKRYRTDNNYPFWQMLKEGADIFELSRRPPLITIRNARYYFMRDMLARASNWQDNKPNSIFYYGRSIADYLHSLRPAAKSLSGPREARAIANWSHKVIYGQKITTRYPPYFS